MKRIFQFLSAAALLSVAVSSCWKIDEGDTVDLAPIEFKVASDTINADLGVELKYEGLTVKSDREVSYEWSYGQPADGKTVATDSDTGVLLMLCRYLYDAAAYR